MHDIDEMNESRSTAGGYIEAATGSAIQVGNTKIHYQDRLVIFFQLIFAL